MPHDTGSCGRGRSVGTSYLGGCSAPGEVQPLKDEADCHSSCTNKEQKNPRLLLGMSQKNTKGECQIQEITTQAVGMSTRHVCSDLSVPKGD